MEEDPILDALSLSFIEDLMTILHPWSFPKPKPRVSPPSIQPLLLQFQAWFPSLSSLLRSIVILVQEHLNYMDKFTSRSSQKPSTLVQESLPEMLPSSRHS